jgi:hypothetical protein
MTDRLDLTRMPGSCDRAWRAASDQQYYNGTRTQLALAKDSPLTRSVQAIGSILPLPILGGLHHRYVRI